MFGHSIVSQHFMEPEGSILNSQQLSTCSYPQPDQSRVRVFEKRVLRRIFGPKRDEVTG
jgi:hypothetical protein